MSNRSPMQRALARLSSLCGSPRAWLMLLALLALAPGAAHAACGTFNVPDANTTPSTSPMASGGAIAINIGYQCDPFGLNPQSGVTQPTHGSVTLSGTDNTIVNYVNNGDGATSDSFVVKDASGIPFTVNVAIGAATSPITVSPASLPTPQVGSSYSQSLSATGGTAPYSFALTSGALPSGLSLVGNTISGTPNQAGSYSATITVTDNTSTTGTKSYTVTVPNPSSGIAVAAPPTAALNAPYSYDLNANTSGALAPYTYSLTTGALPPGLALSGTTISGTPTAVGTYNFSLTVTDASPGPNGPYFKSVNLSITVQNIPPVANAVSATVAYGSTSNPITLNITGGAATSVAIGTAASHGTATASGTSITYTPTTGYAGPDSFTYTATNGAGTSSPATVTITVSPPTLVYAPAAPPHATVGAAYSQSIAGASGGAAPYTYALTAGALPAGLTLASNGTLSGTATAAGTFNFTVTATDSSTGTGPFSVGSAVTLVVDAPTILVAPATLPNGTFNSAYNQTVTASGGTAPYSYAVTAGTLPNGLSLSSAGVLSGTPTQAGDYPITITATDSTTGSAAPYGGSRSYTLHIDGPVITVAPGTVPNATVGTAYSQTLSASGGTTPYTFSATGSLPPGLTLGAGGTLSGTPTTAGDFSFTATATDADSFTGSQAYTVHVSPIAPGAPTAASGTAGDQQVSVSFSPPTDTGGTTITGYTATSSPGGFTASGASSPLTVTGLTNGTSYTFTVTATNSAGTGPASTASNAVTPKGAQTITFNNPGTQNFGTAPTLTATASSGLTPTFSSQTTGVCTISSGGALTFLTAGTCTIDADQAGNGTYLPAPQIQQSFTVAAVVPGAPTMGTATAGNTQATVSFTAPASNGGAAITGYTVTSNPGGITGTSAVSPITVTGLTNGTAYTFTVTATNSAGTGSASAASNSVTPLGTQTITFNNPGSQNFGTSVQMVASATSALAVSFSSTTSAVCTVTSAGVLTTVAPGTCTIQADQAGNGIYLPAASVAQSFTIVVSGGAVSFSTASPLPAGTAGTVYSQTITASGGATPYTFSLVSGSLPTGVTFSSSGALSGTPLASGTFNFTLRVTDAATQTADRSYQLVVAAPTINITPVSLPIGTANSPYSQTITAAGGTAPYTYSTTSTLPTGISLSSSGVLSGTSTQAGSFNITIVATDSTTGPGAPFSGSRAYTLTITSPTITISPGTLSDATVGAAYSQTLSPSGGTAPYIFSASGSLPPGLTLDAGGTLSGAPTTAGDFSFTATATDSDSFTGSQAYTVHVTAVAPAVPTGANATGGDAQASVSFAAPLDTGGAPISGYTVTSSPGGFTGTGAASPITVTGLTNGTAYTFTVTATNSAGTGSASAASNSVTPLGTQTITFNNPGSQNFGTSVQMVASATSALAVSFSSTTSAVCTVTSAGVLTTVAPGTCTIQADQAGNGAYQAASSVTQSFAIVVPGGAVSFSTASPLPSATAEAAYSQTITASGGATPYTFSLVSGSLPAGVTFSSSGVLSGTPLASGTFNVTLRVTDSATQTADKSYQLVVDAPAIALAPATLPGGQVAQAYAQTLTASGGVAPYTFAVTAGALPAGLTLSAGGTLSGTPTAAGTFNVTVTVTDQHGFQGSQAYTLGINQPVPVVVDDTASVNANGQVTVPVTANDSGPFTSIAITQQPAHGTATVNGLDVVYTPAANYFGTDLLKYTATGPGGTSGAATVSITVVAGAVPTAAAQSAKVLAGKSITIHAAAHATDGPFTGAAITTAPTSGTAVVQGTDIVYTADPNASGTFGLDYTLSNAFGTSQPAHVTLTVNPRPVAPALTATTIAGATVQVDLTATAHGGPFTAASVVSILPANAGSATVSSSNGGYTLAFTPAATFGGNAKVSYTLSNAFATSEPGTVDITVELRRDPSKDPEVTGLLDAQAEATHRMAMGQISNFQRRLESLHNGSGRGGFTNGITMSSASSLRRQPLAMIDRQGMGSAGDPFVMPADNAMNAPVADGGTAAPGAVSFWAGGAINFGKLQPGASDNGIDFTTSGLSLGADKQVSQSLTLGMGAGYGHDISDIGQHGSRSAVDSYNVAVYGSYQPGETIYVDALAGYQWLQFDARRFVTDNGNTVHGSRDGKQWFASLSVGYQHQADDMLLTPYGRLDVARAALDGYTETGDAIYALRYQGQTIKTSTANLGLLAQWSVKRDYGMWTPQLRAEFGHDMQGSSVAVMRYADLLSGPLYQATLNRQSRNHTIVGAGFTLQTYKGWSLRAEYQAQIDNTSRDNQSIQLGVQKALQP